MQIFEGYFCRIFGVFGAKIESKISGKLVNKLAFLGWIFVQFKAILGLFRVLAEGSERRMRKSQLNLQ